MGNTAYILVETIGSDKEQILSRLRKINGVVSARSVNGPYDIILFAVAPKAKG